MAEGSLISPRTFQQRLKRGGIEVTLATVWRWCRAKPRKIDARAIGGEWRIRESEVDRMIDVGTPGRRGKRREPART